MVWIRITIPVNANPTIKQIGLIPSKEGIGIVVIVEHHVPGRGGENHPIAVPNINTIDINKQASPIIILIVGD